MHRYQNNAFRILGLLPTVSTADVMRRANEIKVKQSLGIQVAYENDISWMGPLDRSEGNINNALQRLEDPVLRFKEELSWFWIYADSDKQAIALLSDNKKKSAHDIWCERVVDSSPSGSDKCSALFNQAILAHSSVIGQELSVKYIEGADEEKRFYAKWQDSLTCPRCRKTYDDSWKVCLQCGVALVNGKRQAAVKAKKREVVLDDMHWKNWKYAWNKFLYIVYQDFFWDIINEKIKRINDPRLSENKAKEICAQLIPSIIEPNFIFISQALSSKDYERVRKHSGLINGLNLNLGPLSNRSGISPAILNKGLNRILNHHTSYLNSSSQILQNELSESGHKASKEDLLKMYYNFSEKTDILVNEADIVDMNNISDFILARDHASKTVRNISIEIHNRLHDYEKAYEIIKKALEYACSTFQKQQCEKDVKVIKAHFEATRIEAVRNSENYKPSYSSGKAPSDKNFWKKIPGWAWTIGFFVVVSLLSSNSKTTTPSSTSYSSNRHGSSGYTPSTSSYTYSSDETTSRSTLSTKIDNLRNTIKRQESRMQELRAEAKNKENDMVTLKSEIENIQRNYNGASYIPDYIRSDYDGKIQQYNGLVAAHNDYVNQADNMYKDYEANIKEGNRLIAIYNRR